MKELDSRNRAERRAAVLRRTRVAALAVAALILLTSPIVLLSAPGDLPREINHTVFTFSVSALAWLLGRRVALRHAIPFAVGTVLLLSASLLWRGPLVGANPGQFTGAVGITMISAALLVPWGPAAQTFVSTVVSMGFLASGGLDFLSEGGAADAFRVLLTSFALSVMGAWLLDHQRYRTLVENVRVQELARTQDIVILSGQTLSRALEERELFPEVVRVARELVGCDQASLAILNDEAGTSRVVAIDAREPTRALEILNVDMPIAREVVAELERARIAQVPGDSRLLDDRVAPVMRRFGVQRSLFVVLRWGERIFGYLNLDQAGIGEPFTAEQRRAAESLAHQAAIAVRNARLVHDLRAANRTKTDFLSMMSHELRTPLHVITGFTEILDDSLGSSRSEMATDAIARIRRATANLLELVDATLDLTRLDSGRDEPVLEDISLRALFLEAAQDLEPLVTTKSPRIVLEWLPFESAVVRTDARKLRIILRNLVGNALKFTREGRVEVGCEIEDGRLRLTVRDTGVGIPADRIPFVFDMFQQGHSGDDRPYGGVGLGLYIVRRLTEQLGGEVHVESEPGRGSAFTVTVPTAGRALPLGSPNDHPQSPALGI